MINLSKSVKDYLFMRRQLGFELKNAERILDEFVAYMKQQKAPHITSDSEIRKLLRSCQSFLAKDSIHAWTCYAFFGLIAVTGMRTGEAPEKEIPILAMYLGHENPVYTYWYLTATPKLMKLIADGLEKKFGGER